MQARGAKAPEWKGAGRFQELGSQCSQSSPSHSSELSRFPGISCRKQSLVPVAKHQSLEQQGSSVLIVGGGTGNGDSGVLQLHSTRGLEAQGQV